MNLINILQSERLAKVRSSYYQIQINLAYNSNKIEGSTISKDQTRYIFEENSILPDTNTVLVNDIIETRNHFKAFDYILDIADKELNEYHILKLHEILKSGITNIDIERFPIGEYKKEENIIGGFNEVTTTRPENVEYEIQELIDNYNNINNKQLEDIVDFHVKFERIHPFYDGNGRVGRLIAFKECLKNEITPPIILDDFRSFYLLGLKEYSEGSTQRLIDTFKSGQDITNNILIKNGILKQINKDQIKDIK